MSGEPTYSGQTPDIHLFSPILFCPFQMGSHLSRDIYLTVVKHHLIVSISCDFLASFPGFACYGADTDADDEDHDAWRS